ncbi:hypothetical protein BJX76DRAFT_157758 [Aspergillus varians]
MISNVPDFPPIFTHLLVVNLHSFLSDYSHSFISPQSFIPFTTNRRMKFWALLGLAASVAAIPLESPAGRLHKRDGARKHIGYRVVNKKNGGKAVQSIGTHGRQLGRGTYISPRFQDFPDYNPEDGIPWDCVVTVDAAFWDGLKKAWVPEMFEFPEDREDNQDTCRPLPLWTLRWSTNRARFLKTLDADSTLKTCRAGGWGRMYQRDSYRVWTLFTQHLDLCLLCLSIRVIPNIVFKA